MRRAEKSIALLNLSLHYTPRNMKISYKSNKIKISPPTWNDKFELPDPSYSILDMQDYFEHIIKKYETVTDNPTAKIYVKKLKIELLFKN